MKYFKDNKNFVYAYESDGSQNNIIRPDLVPIGEDEAKVLMNQVIQKTISSQTENLNYVGKRSLEYPSIGDQLDALYKAGVFPADMAAKIKAVKDKYPKQ